MKGTPKLPPLSALPREQIEQIESFIEKHELELSIGKQKTAKFILDIYNQEGAKRKKKEKYSKKLLKDAENLILSMQSIPPGQGTRPSEPPPAYVSKPPAGKLKGKKLMESEELAINTKEARIRKKLLEFFEKDGEDSERMVQALLKRGDGEKLAERASELLAEGGELDKLPEKSESTYSRFSEIFGELAGIFEEIGIIDFAGSIYYEQAEALEKCNSEKAPQAYRKAAELLLQSGGAHLAADAYASTISLSPSEEKKILESLHSRLDAAEKAKDYERASGFSLVLYKLTDKDKPEHLEFREKYADYCAKSGSYSTAAFEYSEIERAIYPGGRSYLIDYGYPGTQKGEGIPTGSRFAAFHEKFAKAKEKLAESEDRRHNLTEAAEQYQKAAFTSEDKDNKIKFYRKAAELFIELGYSTKTASCYSSLGALLKETSQGRSDKILEEGALNLEKAAKGFLKSGEVGDASSHYRAAADLARGTNQELSARISERAALKLEEAGASLAKSREFSKAANAYYSAASANKYAAPKKASELYEKSAENYLESGEHSHAADSYENAAHLCKEESEGKAFELYEKAAENHLIAGSTMLADRDYYSAAHQIDKADPLKAAQMHEKRAEFWLKEGNSENAAHAYSSAARLLVPIDLVRAAGTYVKAGEFPEAAQHYFDAACAAEQENNYEKSSTLFEKAADSCLNSRNFPKAAEHYHYAAYRISERNPSLSARILARGEAKLKESADGFAASGDFPNAAEAYSGAAELTKETSLERAVGFFEKAAENRLSSKDFPKAAEAYSKAAQLIRETNPEKAAALYEKAGDNHLKFGNSHLATYSYSDAANLLAEINPEKSAELYEKAVDNAIISEEYNRVAPISPAGRMIKETNPKKAAALFVRLAEASIGSGFFSVGADYGHAAEALEALDPAQSAELRKKEALYNFISMRITDKSSRASSLSAAYPSIAPLIEDFTDSDVLPFRLVKAPLSPEEFKAALELLMETKKEVGFNPARSAQDSKLIAEGITLWIQNDFKKLEGTPNWFQFQAWAATNGDPKKIELLSKVCQSKDFRNSRDKRKEVMWYFEDHAQEKDTEEFFRIAEISSSGKLFGNLRYLMLAKAVNQEFTSGQYKTQEEFSVAAEKELLDFIGKRTSSKEVSETFMKEISRLHSSDFLPAIINMYSRYSGYSGLAQLLDIALISTTMGDFGKVKLPTKEGVESMAYLTPEQKSLLLDSAAQLSFFGDLKEDWAKGAKTTHIAKESAEQAELARKDLAQRTEDLKFHFKEHISSREGELEKEFGFTPEFLDKVQLQIRGIEAAGNQKSKDYIKLKNVERIILSIQQLEGVDPAQAKEMAGELKQTFRGLSQSTAALFKNSYGMSSEDLESLQAKMDINLLSKMLLEEREKLKISKLTAYDSADPVHLILAGKEPDNSGSCQRYDGTPSLMVGLSGYLLKPSIKIIRVENQDGIVVGRSMLKFVTADGKPALFLERAYYRNSASNPEVDQIIVDLAKKKAKGMGIPLITTWRAGGEQKTMQVTAHKGLSPYEYSDAMGGIVQGEKTSSLQVSVL